MSIDGGYRTYAGDDVVTGEGVSVEVPVASVISRVAARLIDLVITFVLAIAAVFAVGMLVGSMSEAVTQAAVLLLVVGLTLGLAGYVYLLDGVLIGAGDGPYLAKAGLITLVVYAPLALVALTLDSGLPALLWLWGSFTLGFMGARAVTLGLRAHDDQWMRLGDS